MKNTWKPNPEQRAILESLRAESAENLNAFCRDFTSDCIGTPSKLSQILDALENGKDSYFNKIEDPAGLMADIEQFMHELPDMKQRKAIAEDVEIFALSHFKAASIAAKEAKTKSNPERMLQYIASTGGSKSFLYLYLAQKLKNEFSFAFVNCRDAWRPASRDMRQRAKLIVLQDICRGLGVRLTGEIKKAKLEHVAAIEDAIVESCRKRTVLMFIEEGRFLSNYALNLFIDLLNRTKVVIVLTCTPFANSALHRYYPDEADQIDRRSHAVIRVTEIKTEDAALFFHDKQFEDPKASLQMICDVASQFGHYSLINRTRKFLDRSTNATEEEVKTALRKAKRELNQADIKKAN